MPTAFAEEADVQDALQKVSLDGAIGSAYVQPAIHAASDWFARQTNGFWFDSGGTIQTDLIATSNTSASDVLLSVPSSPHRQDRMIVSDVTTARYPVTLAGPFAKVVLPHLYVTNVTKLEVRQPDGDVDDWVADANISEGRDAEYYTLAPGQSSYGRTNLYVKASEIGARTNFDGLLTVAYDYGLDYDTTPWDDVKRGVAQLAAAEVASEDSVIAQIPESGTLVGVETQHQQLVDAANGYLGPYLSAMGDNR